MTRHMKTGIFPTALLFIFSNAIGQTSTLNQNSSLSNYSTRAYNQNNARSNHAKMMGGGFDFQVTPQYGINMNGNKIDSLLFRGNGPGFKMDAGYSFGNFGLSFSSGFLSSQTDKTKINEFLTRNGIPTDQMIINTGGQQNMYVLLGPNASFGNKIRAALHAKGGLFINNGGFVNIKRQGAVNSVYRNEPSSKSIYPGFLTGVNIDYHLTDLLTVGLGTDYLYTKTEVVNYDTRRGGAIEGMKLSKNISNLLAGINIKYNIKSPRDAATGLATGRQLGKPKYEDIKARESQSGLSTGKTTAQFNPKEYSIDRANQSCGPVTVKRSFGDGSTEEMIFSCPADAANYAQRTGDYSERPVWTSLNQARTFVAPHVFEKEGMVQRDITARNMIVGNVTWTTNQAGNGIATNKTVRGGGIRMNESQLRTTPNNSFGTLVRLAAREAGTGKATGRSRYEPVFVEGQSQVCNPCLVTVNNPLYESGMQGNNPMYENTARINSEDPADLRPGIEGLTVSLVDISANSVVATTQTEKNGDFFFANVPDGAYAVQLNGEVLSKKGYDVYMKSKMEVGGDIAWSGESVQLLLNTVTGDDNPGMRAGISTSRSNLRTKTLTLIDADTDGDGNFDSFILTGILSDGSSRDLTNDASASRVNKIDAFTIKQTAMNMHFFDSKMGNPAKGVQLSGILVNNSDNGTIKATATFSDGSSFDVTNAVEVKGWDYKVKQCSIVVGDLDGDGSADAVLKITKSRSNIQNNRMVNTNDEEEAPSVVKTKTKSNQSNDRMINKNDEEDAPAVIKTKTKSNQSNDRMMNNMNEQGENLIWSPRSNIELYTIVAADLDGDGKAEETAKITKSRSNIQNNRIMIADLDGDGVPEAAINTSHSNIKNLRVSSGDVDGDGKAEVLVGGLVPGGSILTSAMRPGDPIPDIDVSIKKKNAGTEKRIIQNDKGGLTVIGPDMEPDTYTMTVSTNIFINDETIVFLGGNNDDQRSEGIKQTMQQQVRTTAPGTTHIAINTSHSNIKNMIAMLDEVDQKLNDDQTNTKATINTTRSNIKGHQKMLSDLDQTLDQLAIMDNTKATELLEQKTSAMDAQFNALQKALNNAGAQYNTISNVLKTKHDTVKNSINNIR